MLTNKSLSLPQGLVLATRIGGLLQADQTGQIVLPKPYAMRVSGQLVGNVVGI